MSVDTFDIKEWEGPAGPAGAVFDLMQRTYTARTNEKDLGVIAREILALEGDERVRAREAFALLAGMPAESPVFNELGRCGLRALRTGELNYFREPGFFPEQMLKIRLFNVRSALKRPTKGQKKMTTATAEATRNDAACVLISLIDDSERRRQTVGIGNGIGGNTVYVLDEDVVHQITTDRPNYDAGDDGTVCSEARYRALKITPATGVTVHTFRDGDGERVNWIFSFGEDELRLSGEQDSPEANFAKQVYIQATKVAVLA